MNAARKVITGLLRMETADLVTVTPEGQWEELVIPSLGSALVIHAMEEGTVLNVRCVL